MLKYKISMLKKYLALADTLLVSLSFFTVKILSGPVFGLYSGGLSADLLLIFLASWALLLRFFRSYEIFWYKDRFNFFASVIKTGGMGFILFISYISIFGSARAGTMDKAVICFLFSVSTVFVSAGRIIFIAFLNYLRRKGYNCDYILIVGTGDKSREFIDIVERHAEWGLRISGVMSAGVTCDKGVKKFHGYEILGSFEDIPRIIHDNVVDYVIFILPSASLAEIEDIMRFCEMEGVKIAAGLDHYEPKLARARQADLNGFPLLLFESTPPGKGQLFMKKVFDIIFSALMLFILLPLFAIIALSVKMTSRGPVFFRQERCGLNGRKFIMYKFRTMVEGAEHKRDELLENNIMEGPVFKIKDDPRNTNVGRFLRKFSLDELPQLYNVLKGEMSVIGPRPLPLKENQYKPGQKRRLSVKPGITGLWQISGRNKITDFDEWVKLDLEYIDNWSILLDARIFLKTIAVVIFGTGAE
ncbi:MAG: sugar transferase [Candidatus Omnitrophota bacterium]